MVSTKANSSISLGSTDSEIWVKLIEKWSEKASVVWTLEILLLLDLVKPGQEYVHEYESGS